jgi:hypothetical protein
MQILAVAMVFALSGQLSEQTVSGNDFQTAPASSPLTLAEGFGNAPTPAEHTEQPGVEPSESPSEVTVPPAARAAEGGTSESAFEQRSVLAQYAKPTDLMRQLMMPPAAGQLSGQPLTLGEAVRDARDRHEQTLRAKAYWDLAAAVGDYNLAILEQTELGVLNKSVTAPSALWSAKLNEARGRVELAKHAAQGAQLRLHQLLSNRSGGLLPLPADAPHCGRYNAEYDEIFAANPDPFAKQLSDLMPLRYAELRSQAQAVAEAQAARDRASQSHNPASGGQELLQAQDLLSLKRRAFVATARDYNYEIAQYTELAAPAEVAPDRLVAMMIRTSTAGSDLPWKASGVQQATAQEALPPDVAALPPSVEPATGTAAPQADGRDGVREVRRPLQRLLDRNREHSIVSGIRRLRQRVEQ